MLTTPNFGIEGLLRVSMPRISSPKQAQVQGLADAYDKRESLPKAHERKVQLAIDQAVCIHLEFDEGIYLIARHLLAQEAMVTGKHYQHR